METTEPTPPPGTRRPTRGVGPDVRTVSARKRVRAAFRKTYYDRTKRGRKPGTPMKAWARTSTDPLVREWLVRKRGEARR